MRNFTLRQKSKPVSLKLLNMRLLKAPKHRSIALNGPNKSMHENPSRKTALGSSSNSSGSPGNSDDSGGDSGCSGNS